LAALLELRGIERRFGATAALSGVDIDLAPGEVRALIGENGAGKSTLVRILSGELAPDGGEMRFSGGRYAPRSPADARRLGVAHIHQELSLCPHLSVAENVLLGNEPARRGWIRRGRLVSETGRLLAEFGRREIDPRSRVGDLSLADRQVVEICRALARDARLLLMDEPTSALPRPDVLRLFRLVRRLAGRGIAVLYISHFLEEVREIAATYTVLRDGAVVAHGGLAAVRDDELVSRMVGRDIASATAGPARAPEAGELGELLLEVRDLASPPRLRAASFDLRGGEILGIAGLVGSGRTDLVRALFGLRAASAGRVRLRGREVALGEGLAGERIRRRIGYLPEDRKAEGLALPLPIADNVTMTRWATCSRRGWIDRGLQRDQARAAMERARVRGPGAFGPVERLSGGNQQKVALARLLHQDPDVLLCDEPARGIDVASREEIFGEIRRLAASGKGILMVDSYLPDLLRVCDRIAVMVRGSLSGSRPAIDWTEESLLESAIGAPLHPTLFPPKRGEGEES
jgi:ribose transport system ATP-binding protein